MNNPVRIQVPLGDREKAATASVFRLTELKSVEVANPPPMDLDAFLPPEPKVKDDPTPIKQVSPENESYNLDLSDLNGSSSK